MDLSKNLKQSNKKIKLTLTGDLYKDTIKVAKMLGKQANYISPNEIMDFYNTMFPKMESITEIENNDEFIVYSIKTIFRKANKIILSKNNVYKNKINITYNHELRWNFDFVVGLIKIYKTFEQSLNDKELANEQKRFLFLLAFNKRFLRLVEPLNTFCTVLVEEINTFINKHNDTIDFNSHSDKSIATAFDTKKHINKSTQSTMSNSLLNDKFKYIELDNEVDLNKIKEYEVNLNNFLNNFNVLDTSNLTFRLRKLGKHKAIGLYNNSQKTVVVDFRESQSTVHEFAHAFDFSFDTPLSYDDKFDFIVKLYQENLNTDNLTKSKISYFMNRHEIFARAFEVYYFNTYGYNEMISKNLKVLENEFKPFSLIQNEIINYFDSILASLQVNYKAI